MTMLVCPLCKKFNSYHNFSVAEELDIIGIETKGLGRGKGIKIMNRYSILSPHDPVVLQIKGRILELTEVLMAHKCLTSEEILSRLGIAGKKEQTESIIEQLTESTIALQRELHGLKRDYATLKVDRDHRKTQARELYDEVIHYRDKVAHLEEQITNLSEELI